jgi:hypothetical protein
MAKEAKGKAKTGRHHRKVSPTFMPVGLQAKLGTAFALVQQMGSSGGSVPPELQTVLGDAEVVDWMKRMDADGYLPKPKT